MTDVATGPKPGRGETPLGRIVRDFARSKIAVASLAIFVLLILLAVFAPLVAPQNPYDLAQLSILDGMLPPGSESFEGMVYWLGTDDQGRDMLSAILYGLRVSLGVGVSSTVIALAIGIVAGLTAAYFGGKVDSLVMRVVDLQLGFPSILLALILLAILGKGVDKVVIALVAVQWAYYARTIRGAALVERKREYIEAATCLGLDHRRIVLGHLMPNCLPPLIVVATVQVAHAIALEATLSFLGVGVPVTEPSLGMLIANGFDYLLSGHMWISIYPGIALVITIVSINLVGDQLRDVLNPRLQR
ncbi:ABC transporter permease [Inquilinus sp. CAU 1745]|uniref:ABC transporter permease n=1 Tax=Inquilinus sp. CAU 1745 TaxID=3140369 RepID=UPI00325A605D